MKRLICFLLWSVLVVSGVAAEPLRVFIRAGSSNRGREVHAHPRFLEEWRPLLAGRGITVDGALDWPTPEQMARTDVILAYAQDGGDATPEQETAINEYLKRGGGLVVLHTASVAKVNPGWWREVLGGAWKPGNTRWKEGPMDFYYTENQRLDGGHPITRGASNFHLDDEIYYDMDMKPGARVLGASYTPKVANGKKSAEGGKAHIYDIQPQMWVYESTWEGGARPYRSVVSLLGHKFRTFEMPHYRAVILRSLAWAARRDNLEEYVQKEELASLLYPAGGPQKPADTLANLEVHPDFSLKLVASEPLINKPINFDWAPDGSLWVAETPEYPNGRRGMRPDYRGREWMDHGGVDPTPGEQQRKAQDKISRLIDTDGDGVMDKKEVFYDGLDLVTGFVFHKDGVIVTQAPEILFLRDTDGDGKADKTEVLFTGLGMGDTHAVINNPRWGWDGWVYATHGYSGSSAVKNVRGEKMPNLGSGVVRFRPDGSAIEQYTSKGGNTWGLQVTADNRVMWTQPTSGQLLMHTVLPEHTLARGKVGRAAGYHVVEKSGKTFPALSWEQMAYVQIDWVGSFTAAAGTVIYDGGAWPAEYNGDYFCTEPTINIVHHARLTPEGSSYTFHKLPGREETEFIRSKDMWWRPIEVRVGPEGGVYIGDFYNQAVIHNDTRGPDHNKVNAAVRPDRDHYFGRIWRIDHKQARKLAVPNLNASPGEAEAALRHPNRAVRMSALRLLSEGAQASKAGALKAVEAAKALAADASAENRITALWLGFHGHRAGADAGAGAAWLAAFVSDKDAGVRRNVALAIEAGAQAPAAGGGASVPADRGLEALLGDSDPQVRLAALRALAAEGLSEASAKALVAAFPKLEDDFQRSAAIAAAAGSPSRVLSLALDVAEPAAVAPLVGALTQALTDPAEVSKLVVSLAGKPASTDGLKRSILESLARTVESAPAMSVELGEAFTKLLNGGAAAAALPLAVNWDKAGVLKPVTAGLVDALFKRLREGVENDRLAAGETLLGLRGANAEALPAVAKLLADAGLSAGAKVRLIGLLAETGDRAVGQALVAVFGSLDAGGQLAAFEAFLKRGEWTVALLEAAAAKRVEIAKLGPANLNRLRRHPDPAVSNRAEKVLEDLNPQRATMNEKIAKLAPEVEGEGGDPAKGKALFATTCAICHVFDGHGKEIGPGLTGMGAHGAAELLTAIVDPNREVEPSYVTWNFELKNGQFVAGVIARENPAAVILRNLTGEQELKTADIKARVNTGVSLMPEGFDVLGGAQLRDLIAYMRSVDGGRFRVLDLKSAFTATSARGLYQTNAANPEMVQFKRFGSVKFGGIPFNLVAADKAATGRNVVQLQGGPKAAFSKTLPASVEVSGGGFRANRLHFLGGVGGWAHPYSRDEFVVMKAVVHLVGGGSETLEFKNGVEFADYIARNEVPGSKYCEDLTSGRAQVRWYSAALKSAGAIEKIVLESTNTMVAPTTFAITAELADPNAPPLEKPESKPAPAPAKPVAAQDSDADFKPQFSDPVPEPPATRPAKGPRVLLVGGGSSHDFVKFFGNTDKETLASVAGWVDFTQNLNGIGAVLDRVDVLVLSANQPVSAATRKALLEYAARGGAIVAHHPGTWYAWRNFPQWNKEIVGGGARGHDALGPYTAKVEVADHPITKGVPAGFEITDELYNFVEDPEATPVQVLVSAASPKSGKVFPQVFVVKHPKARIVGLTLGHDARAHDLPAYQTLLRNAVLWTASK